MEVDVPSGADSPINSPGLVHGSCTPQASGALRTPGSTGSSRLAALYKRSTPKYSKEIMRQRCLARMRESRGRLADRYRVGLDGVVREVMAEEWREMQQNLSEKELDMYITAYEELQSELLDQDQAMIDDYLSSAPNLEEEGLCLPPALPVAEQMPLLCPVCNQNFLSQIGTVITCACGIKVDVEQDGTSLSYLKRQLEIALSCHEPCNAKPSVTVSRPAGIDNFVMTCSVCNFMFLVL